MGRIGTELPRTGTGAGWSACGNGWEQEWKTSPVPTLYSPRTLQ